MLEIQNISAGYGKETVLEYATVLFEMLCTIFLWHLIFQMRLLWLTAKRYSLRKAPKN